MMRSLLFIVLLLISWTTLASERMEAATLSLQQQVQLIALVGSDEAFLHYRQRLVSDPILSVDEFKEISSAVSQFWHRHGIASRMPEAIYDEDPFTAAMAIEPDIKGYLQLSNRIRYLSWLANTQSWTVITPDVWLQLGDIHRDVSAITARLVWLGDYKEEGSPHRLPVKPLLEHQEYDHALQQAVLRFQRRHGLKPDAIIGPATLSWLNRPPLERAKLLATNFVKQAQYMTDVGKRYLLINIPAYEMVLVDDDKVALRSRVIVGKPYRQTPIIKGEISNLVLNPSWRVPRRLLKYDLLPKVRQDGSYLSRQNFEVFDYTGEQVIKTDAEWRDMAKGQFPYRLVQKPGVDNTLGRYKFFFPNQYSVYLHDTTDKQLFTRSDRALSSGCIRVEKVEQLANWMASYLVRDKQTWVDMQIERSKTQWFAFDDKLPVHLVYWTSWIDGQNVAQFRDDIYNRNQNITAVLQAKN